jgi:hypothetical protein
MVQPASVEPPGEVSTLVHRLARMEEEVCQFRWCRLQTLGHTPLQLWSQVYRLYRRRRLHPARVQLQLRRQVLLLHLRLVRSMVRRRPVQSKPPKGPSRCGSY